MTRQSLDLDAVKAFIQIVELGSFTHAADVRFHVGRNDGKVIIEEKFGWFASPGWQRSVGQPLPLATMAEPCGVRAMSTQLLSEAGVSWNEVFVGGGVMAVAAAVMAGLGVAALSPRMVPFGALDVGHRLALPELPRMPVVLHTRVKNDRAREALAALSAAFRSAVRS
jgi:DNA-binding transcriptional LysR family regulator